MKPWVHKIEVIVDKSIPYLVLILLVLLIGEFTHYKLVEENENIVLIIDYFVVLVFIVDLSFKYYRVKDSKIFIKKYWLDIIAVFPFFLLFRLVEEVILFFRIGSEIFKAQDILTIVHTGVEVSGISSDEAKALREIQEATRLERTARITRIIRPLERIPRILRVLHFFEIPFRKKN